MRKRTYIKKMKKHEESFDRVWKRIVKDTNDFIKDNPEISMNDFMNNIDHFKDYIILSGAWIEDRINGKYPKDRGSLTKKIRKDLGFTYP